jgi:2-dehydro-3-deoxygluconokinase
VSAAWPEVATLGEALVVFDPLSAGPLRHVEGFRKRVGGAELNVAVALARLGHRASGSLLLTGIEVGSLAGEDPLKQRS